MNSHINLSLIELLLSLIIGVVTVFITKSVLMRYYLKHTDNSQQIYKNLSFMLFLSGSIFAVSYIVFGIMEPLSSTIKLLSNTKLNSGEFIFEMTKYFLLFLLLGLIFGGFIIFSTYKLFTLLTKQLDEFKEISEGNIGVGLLVAVLSIVIALFTKNPFIIFIESLIPYPELPGIM